MSYSDLTDSDKQRLGASFFNIKDQKSTMPKVDWENVNKDFTLTSADITAASFRTSITRMKKTFSNLSPSDKHRLAASFFHMNAEYRASIMKDITVNWTKATKDFKPEGKPISAVSFKTSIGRLLSNYTTGTGSITTPTASRKRKATTAARGSPAESTQVTTTRKRTKTVQTAAAVAESSISSIPM